jgi:hypothetical protein
MMHLISAGATRTARAAIRRVHRNLCTRLCAGLASDDATLAQDFVAIVAAVEAGFRHEQAVLDRIGHASLRACIEDNAVFLRALHRAQPDVENGDVNLGRQVLSALHDVLLLRRVACDAALAAAASPVHGLSLRMRMRLARPAPWRGHRRDLHSRPLHRG